MQLDTIGRPRSHTGLLPGTGPSETQPGERRADRPGAVEPMDEGRGRLGPVRPRVARLSPSGGGGPGHGGSPASAGTGAGAPTVEADVASVRFRQHPGRRRRRRRPIRPHARTRPEAPAGGCTQGPRPAGPPGTRAGPTDAPPRPRRSPRQAPPATPPRRAPGHAGPPAPAPANRPRRAFCGPRSRPVACWRRHNSPA